MQINVNNCLASGATEYARLKCEGSRWCDISVAEMAAEFGDPCWGIWKYVEIRYDCVGHFTTCSPMDLTSGHVEAVNDGLRVSSISLITDDSGGQCAPSNFGFSPSTVWTKAGCAGQFGVCVDYMDACIDGYFGHYCAFSCACKGGEVCNKITGSCPSGCRDNRWGPGCQLEHTCYYNHKGASVYEGNLPIGEVSKCACPWGRFGNNCEEECDCRQWWKSCHTFWGICDGFEIPTTQIPEDVIEIIPKPNRPIYPGNEVAMKCANVSAIVGKEVKVYFWRHNGTDISNSTEDTFTITDFNETNVGNYSCVMDFDDGSQSVSEDIEIELDDTLPLMMSKFTKIPVGTPMKFQCITKNRRHNFYQWFFNGEIIQTGPNKWYRLKQFNEVNQGNYSCSASDEGMYYEKYSEEVPLTTIPRNSICKCPCPKHILELGKMTDEQLGEKVKEIVKELVVKTDNLTSTIRRKKSSEDKRAASVYAGYGAITIYVVVFGSILLLDFMSLLNWLWERRTKRIRLEQREARKREGEMQALECQQMKRRGIALSEM